MLGNGQSFTSYGGIVAGQFNTIGAEFASVTGGYGSTASQSFASVLGGEDNTASGNFACVSGGDGNTASGGDASILGGENGKPPTEFDSKAGSGEWFASELGPVPAPRPSSSCWG
jgi:hypothetical protein